MKITTPSEILDQMHTLLSYTLQQTKGEENMQDGMDMALCSIDLENKVVEYAGARNPLYLVEDNKIEIIKGDPLSIGGKRPSKLRETGHRYKLHTRRINSGLSLYLFSDGYIDQHGGERGKTLGSRQFQEFLLNISNKNAEEQKNILVGEIERWKGERRQTDDMLIVGMKVSAG